MSRTSLAVIVLWTAAIFAVITAATATVPPVPPVPVCPEDSVAMGAPGADYVGGYGWTDMVCIAIDDITSGVNP